MKKLFTIVVLLINLNVFAQEQFSNYRITQDFSPANDISAIRFDSRGSMWVATWFGLYKYEQSKWTPCGPENVCVQTFFIDSHDKKWIGLWAGGLHTSQDGNTWATVNSAGALSAVNIVAPGSDSTVWVGDYSKGVLMLNGEQSVKYKSGDVALGDNSILSIVEGINNQTWFGSYHGLSVFDGKTWKLYNKQNSGLPDNNVYALATGSKGSIWIGTCKGLAKLSGKSWVVYNKSNSALSSDLILSLATDAKGNIWVGTNKGLNFFDGKAWKHFTVANSNLMDDRVQAISLYNNAVYIGTSKGISVFK